SNASLRPQGEPIVDRAYPESLRTDQSKYHAYRNRWLTSDPRSLGANFEMLAKMSITKDLDCLPKRSLFIAGTFDAFRPPSEVDRVAQFVPHSEVLHIPSGHFMATQSPRLVATLFEAFIYADAKCGPLCMEFLAH